MRVALLALALGLALLASAARADQFSDNEEVQEPFEAADEADFDDADDDDDDEAQDLVAKEECPRDPKTERKTLGGKEISQETENISVMGRCIRVLSGSTPEAYTEAGSCSRCKSDGTHLSCVGSPTAMSSTCSLVTGPDCKPYSVQFSDPTKAC